MNQNQVSNETTQPDLFKPYTGQLYKPCKPQADSPELSAQSARLIFTHAGNRYCTLELFIAKQGVDYSGWVIGTHVQLS